MLSGKRSIEINLNTEQQGLMDRVNDRAEIYDDKTGRNWANSFAQSLAHYVYHNLHSVEQQALQTTLSSVINPKNIRDLPAVTSYLERFAYYVEVTENTNLPTQYGLARKVNGFFTLDDLSR